ncbi:CidA/LrgA family protein [Fredinandcohnia sp. 179-A 10B2 NHS]|uniref:CidA/LrgA family protein n=1 Tax=Fredinandcohnia sp. 179-A 10B2 NHS TaxID=3235176 RepID=UPI0039A1449B
MKFIKVCVQISILYLFYFLGTLIQNVVGTSIPGSIIGMLLLFLLLQLKIVKENWLASGAQFLLTYLALLFVPATVGLIDYLPFFRGKGLVTVGIVLASTFLVMLLSSKVGQLIAKGRKTDLRKDIEGGFDV